MVGRSRNWNIITGTFCGIFRNIIPGCSDATLLGGRVANIGRVAHWSIESRIIFSRRSVYRYRYADGPVYMYTQP